MMRLVYTNKQHLISYSHVFLDGIQDLVVGEVTNAMANDGSEFKLGRFSHFLSVKCAFAYLTHTCVGTNTLF